MSVFPPALSDRARAFIERASHYGLTVATAESCTGGLVAGLLTEIAGSSAVVECGFVTYSNAAKTALLGVPEGLVQTHGAVSQEVARAMAEGALQRSHASISVAITGIAGPGGGSQVKPVGLVYFASAMRNGRTVHAERRFGDTGRSSVRMEAVGFALQLLSQAIEAQAAGASPGP